MPSNKKFFRVNKDTGKIFEFASIEPTLIFKNESGDYVNKSSTDIRETPHSYWVEYVESYEEYVENDIKKARYKFSINGIDYGNLEKLQLGCVYKPDHPAILPPNAYVFDTLSAEWKSPLFELDGIKIWNPIMQQYEKLNQD